MSKYKQQVEEMLLRNKAMFDSFRELHDKYAADPKKWQEKFNEEGEDVLVVIGAEHERGVGHAATGNSTTKVVPLPGALSTPMRPSCASTIAFEM